MVVVFSWYRCDVGATKWMPRYSFFLFTPGLVLNSPGVNNAADNYTPKEAELQTELDKAMVRKT